MYKREISVMNYLVVFRSKSETLKFASILASYGHKSAIVSTPRQISVSCGVSARIDFKALETAKNIVSRRQFYTFAGIFISNNNEYVKA